MLVLSRKVGERIMIEEGIVVLVTRISGNKVRLGIEAPDGVRIDREEVYSARRRDADDGGAVE